MPSSSSSLSLSSSSSVDNITKHIFESILSQGILLNDIVFNNNRLFTRHSSSSNSSSSNNNNNIFSSKILSLSLSTTSTSKSSSYISSIVSFGNRILERINNTMNMNNNVFLCNIANETISSSSYSLLFVTGMKCIFFYGIIPFYFFHKWCFPSLTVSTNNTLTWYDKMKIQFEIMNIQRKEMMKFSLFNDNDNDNDKRKDSKFSFFFHILPMIYYEIYNVTRLEYIRRCEMKKNEKLGIPRGQFEEGLPHVDTQTISSSKKNKNKNNKKNMNMNMMNKEINIPIVQDLVFIGGGHAHVFCFKNLGMHPIPGIRITIISRDVITPYSGMLPGYIAGLYEKEECHIDVSIAAKFCGARFIHAEAVGIDHEKKCIYLKDSTTNSTTLTSTSTATSTSTTEIDDTDYRHHHYTHFANTNRPPISYDVLSINIGSCPQLFDLNNNNNNNNEKIMENHHQSHEMLTITPVKPIDQFSSRWDMILNKIYCLTNNNNIKNKNSNKNVLDFVTVGAGAGGIELTLSMQKRIEYELLQRLQMKKKENNDDDEDDDSYYHDYKEMVKFTVLSSSNTILPQHSIATQNIFKRICKERNITIVYNCKAIGISNNNNNNNNNNTNTKGIMGSNGEFYKADECIWCTNASAVKWLQKETTLQLDEQGFIKVNEYMETNLEGVFAAGDIASLPDPRAKAGVFAVRAGPVLTQNIRATLLGQREKEMVKYIPQKFFLGIIGTGDTNNAIASKGYMAMEGKWLWDLKDWIDRKWMAGYKEVLIVMKEKMMIEMEGHTPINHAAVKAGPEALYAISKHRMRCGGCGAKVGANVLKQVMNKLKENNAILKRDEVIIGLDEPDDCAMIALPSNISNNKNIQLIQTVDFFRSFIDDPYIFGQIAANHALSDCHAMCAEAVTALAIAVVPFGIESKVSDTLYQMMAGACKVLKESNCSLVGGHSCEGAELSLGFAINGVADKDKVLSKGGITRGQKIIITKPIGTGVIFAADMRLRAKGIWVKTAKESMVISNMEAALCLRRNGATSCTDVTGFGLLGHLVEMVQASGVALSLDLKAIPLLPGALECVEMGIFSSLQPANLRLKDSVKNIKEVKDSKLFPLIFDPQTAGGLLASVPADKAETAIRELRLLGYETAAVIGDVIGEHSGWNIDCITCNV